MVLLIRNESSLLLSILGNGSSYMRRIPPSLSSDREMLELIRDKSTLPVSKLGNGLPDKR
jgi:hypothetical protein